ncbi:hypothetical protein LMH73_013125 [Vibrio splendidus]|nr:hypothetical protein [Vibrio splendidus]MCC4880714.1 hypothetical protein [Vibrio splendidus]
MEKENFKDIVHLKPEHEFNSEQFWSIGGSYMRMSRELYQDFEAELSKITWVLDNTGEHYSSPLGLRIPDDEMPKNMTDMERLRFLNKHVTSSLSPEFISCIERLLISNQTFELQNLYDFKIVFSDLWNGSEGCPWHWDGTDSGDAIILAYFTDHSSWKPEFGGQLEIGRNLAERSVYLSKIKKTESFGFIPPKKQGWVLVNNKNPHLIHRCNKLHKDSERRMTLTLGIEFVIKEDLNDKSKVIWPE